MARVRQHFCSLAAQRLLYALFVRQLDSTRGRLIHYRSRSRVYAMNRHGERGAKVSTSPTRRHF